MVVVVAKCVDIGGRRGLGRIIVNRGTPPGGDGGSCAWGGGGGAGGGGGLQEDTDVVALYQ